MAKAWFRGGVNNVLSDRSAGNYKDAESAGANVTPSDTDDICISDVSYATGNVVLGAALACGHLYGLSSDTGGTNNFSSIVDFASYALSAGGDIQVTKLDTGSNTGSSCVNLNATTNMDFSGGGIITVSGNWAGKGGGFGETGGVKLTGSGKSITIAFYDVVPNFEIESGASYTTTKGIYTTTKFHIHGTLTCNSPGFVLAASGIADQDFAGGTFDGTGYFQLNNYSPTNGTLNIEVLCYGGVIIPVRTYGGLVHYDIGYVGYPYQLAASGTYALNGGMKWDSAIAHAANSLDFNACDVTINGLDMSDTKSTTDFDFASATVKLKGNIDLAALGTVTKGTATIEINGTAAQDIKFNDKDLPPVEVTNVSGIVTFSQGFTSDLTCDTPAVSMKFQAGEDFLGDWNLAGALGSLIVLRSTTNGVAWNLIDDVTADYVDVKDSNASNPVTQTNCTDSGGNTNWFVTLYALTVTNGTGDGNFAEASVNAIAADAPAAHKEFDRWTGDVGYLDDEFDPTTNVTMPAAAVAVTATYKDIFYDLTVVDGSGSGSYLFGTSVDITADAPPSGYEFAEWGGDVSQILDKYDPTTKFDIGEGSWTATALYSKIPPVANFSGTPTSGAVPLSVAFTDSSTNTPTSWLWDFGDLGSSTLQNPSHVYAIAGTYTVKLTATNAGGSDDETKVGYITVTAVPFPSSGDSDLNANTMQAGGFLCG